MDRAVQGKLRIGEWCVDPISGEISRAGETARIEARALRLLLSLSEQPGEVVSLEALLDRVWPDVSVAPDSVYHAVASLRRLLGDDSKDPVYIATVPRLGYRLVAAVGPWNEVAEVAATTEIDDPIEGEAALLKHAPSLRTGIFWSLGVALLLALVAVFAMHGKGANSGPVPNTTGASQRPVERSIAVLPFLDLTQGMQQEEFADGMTEELIDNLIKISGLRVASATSVYYYKAKQLPVAEIAGALGVTYVLDGSVRKSGGRVRVAARLVRAETGFVVWTETYERPFGDILMVQDEIAGEVAKALGSPTQLGAK
jgi:TolB-like protein/DNA-binding winged helix-turn-helix (wHTH) protein